MKDFFQNKSYTEFFNPNTAEIWVFGDTPENISENTPHQFVAVDPNWGDGTETEMELPVTDGHGQRELQTGRVYVGQNYEILGTTAEKQISEFWKFNY